MTKALHVLFLLFLTVSALGQETKIYVNTKATGGNGTAASPWTGWDQATPWASDKTFYFPSGYYSYSATPGWALSRIRLIGDGGAILKYTGTGNAFELATDYVVFNVEVKGLRIVGNASATNGLLLRSIHHSKFEDVRVVDVPGAAVRVEFGVNNTFDNVRYTENEWNHVGVGVIPSYGFYITRRNGPEISTSSVFMNTLVDSVTADAYYFEHASTMTVIGGVAEASNRGMHVASTADTVTLVNFHAERNAAEDILIEGANTTITSSEAVNNKLRFSSTASGSQVYGGTFDSIQIDAGATNISLLAVTYDRTSGTFTNHGTNTTHVGLRTAAGVTVDNLLARVTTAPGLRVNAPTPSTAAGELGIGTSTATTVGGAGNADKLPARPTTYLVMSIGGQEYKIPLYNP